MEFTKLEHIGIAVENLDKSILLYERLSGSKCYKIEEVASEKVRTAFIDAGNTKIELVEATDQESVISKYIQNRGEGIHHLAYEVENIEASMEKLKAQGFRLLNEKPKKGADNKLVCFVHPKDTNGILIEICQEITSAHTE